MIQKHLHWILVVGGVTLLGLVFTILPDDAEATRAPSVSALSSDASTTTDLSSHVELPLSVPSHTLRKEMTDPALPEAKGEWVSVKVKSGDNLAKVFDRNGLSPQELYKATRDKEAASQFKKIFPGDVLQLRIDNGMLTELNYEYELGQTLHLVRLNDDDFKSETIEKPLETRVNQATGIIKDSLFLSAQRAGLSDKLTMELSEIFGWDIDFALDIREGDQFTVLYEELYLDGEKVRDGRIIAAEFVNQNDAHQAFLYTDAKGHSEYYAANGTSMRKAFLRTPVAFTRISSRFTLSRKHPILNKIRAHKGVDYSAPTGTPIKASGDGKIIYRGVKGGYGNTIVIQHGSTYSTLYAHMSKFAKGMHSGKRVRQGQTIGYVGMTGLATGPHLHYEFRVNGVHRNPLTVKLPSSEPLPKKYMADFETKSRRLLARLELIKRTQLALASDTQQ